MNLYKTEGYNHSSLIMNISDRNGQLWGVQRKTEEYDDAGMDELHVMIQRTITCSCWAVTVGWDVLGCDGCDYLNLFNTQEENSVFTCWIWSQAATGCKWKKILMEILKLELRRGVNYLHVSTPTLRDVHLLAADVKDHFNVCNVEQLYNMCFCAGYKHYFILFTV